MFIGKGLAIDDDDSGLVAQIRTLLEYSDKSKAIPSDSITQPEPDTANTNNSNNTASEETNTEDENNVGNAAENTDADAKNTENASDVRVDDVDSKTEKSDDKVKKAKKSGGNKGGSSSSPNNKGSGEGFKASKRSIGYP